MTDSDSGSHDRRTVLKGAAGLGLVATGLGSASGSATAADGDDLFDDINLTKDLEDGGTFDGKLDIDQLQLVEGDDGDTDLEIGGKIEGVEETADGTTEEIEEEFTISGLLDDLLGVLQPDEAGECPILELELEPLFLDVLGLQVETSTIELDVTAVAGEGNLLGNLLCAVAGLLDPE